MRPVRNGSYEIAEWGKPQACGPDTAVYECRNVTASHLAIYEWTSGIHEWSMGSWVLPGVSTQYRLHMMGGQECGHWKAWRYMHACWVNKWYCLQQPCRSRVLLYRYAYYATKPQTFLQKIQKTRTWYFDLDRIRWTSCSVDKISNVMMIFR